MPEASRRSGFSREHLYELANNSRLKPLLHRDNQSERSRFNSEDTKYRRDYFSTAATRRVRSSLIFSASALLVYPCSISGWISTCKAAW